MKRTRMVREQTTPIFTKTKKQTPYIPHHYPPSIILIKINKQTTLFFRTMSTTTTTTTTTYATDTIYLFINGQKHIVVRPEPDTSLIQYLRSKNLTGTKLGCNEGGCGACTVMLSHYDLALDRVVNRSVNACLMPLLSCDSCAVVTVEGIGSSRDTLHLIQERIKEYNGSQCGFCTPGIVMSLYTLLRNEPRPSLEQIEQCLDGNLCRCTGYRPILDAAKTLVNASSSCCGGASSVGGGGGCCGGGGGGDRKSVV